MAGLKFVCIVASVREGRLGERMIKLLQAQFETEMAPKGHSLEIVDPSTYDLPLLKKPFHFYKDSSEAPENLQKLNHAIDSADVYIVLTAEYNASLPPALINTIDHIPPASFAHKISGIIAYTMGPFGGCSAISAARPLLTEMGCLPVKNFVSISRGHHEVSEEGRTENTHVITSMKKLFDEMVWWGQAAKNARDE